MGVRIPRPPFALLILLCAWTHATSAQAGAAETLRKLPAPETIDGVSCGATGGASAEFFSSGALKSCPLARDTVIQGHALPANTWIGLTELHTLQFAWLPRDVSLGGHLCHGVGYKGYAVRFYDDGALQLCFLANDTVVDGVPCIHGSFWTEIRGGSKSVVNFQHDGSLASCQLSDDVTFAGVRYTKWTRVTRDAKGQVSRPSPAGR